MILLMFKPDPIPSGALRERQAQGDQFSGLLFLQALHQVVALELAEISLDDGHNWFGHCCYCD
jgi:hypothetical protein